MLTIKTKEQIAESIATVLVMAHDEFSAFKQAELNVAMDNLCALHDIKRCMVDGYIELIRG